MAKNALPPALKGYITDNKTGVRTEITKDIINWRELAVGQKRRGFSGVFIEIQQPLEVCRAAMTLIQTAFNLDTLGLDMTFEIQKRLDIFNNGYCTMRYEKIHSMRLNPGTYEEYAEYLSIEGQSLTFDSLLRSVGKTKYDIPVAGMSTANWRYNHNPVFVVGDWTLPEDAPIQPKVLIAQMYTTLSATLNGATMPPGGIENDFTSQRISDMAYPYTTDTYFFESAKGGQTVRLLIDFIATYTYNKANADPGDGTTIRFDITKHDAAGIMLATVDTQAYQDANKTGLFDISYNKSLDITLNKGERLVIALRGRDVIDTGLVHGDTFTITKFNKFQLKYTDTPFEVDVTEDGSEIRQLYTDIPAITSTTLANILLSKMAGNDTAKTYTAQIDTDTDNPWSFNHYLVAAESIRGFEDANFHANFNDFLEYMQFLGYEYETDETARVVHFRKRADFFNPSITALELSAREVANMKIAADNEYAYSTVRVGYEKPDIENTNGRFAMCGAFDYSTDFRNHGDVKDSSLEIMCPYKADPVEIETLSWTRGEKTTDQKADNDIFMLAGELSGGYVIETRQAQYMVRDTDLNRSIGWFNVPYIPYFITKRNTGKIGVAVKNLTFTGTDAYRDATLSGVVSDNPYSNVAVTGLFKPLVYEFDAGTHKGLPPEALRSGLVRLRWQGRMLEGYTKELIKNDCAEQSELWTLYAK